MSNVMLTLGSFILLSTILVAFYGNLAVGEGTVSNAQAGINQLTYATTYMELANGLSFDEATVDSFVTAASIDRLTAPSNLGMDFPALYPEPDETGFTTFDDIDDLNNFTITDSSLFGISGVFKTIFNVHYVDPMNLNLYKTTRTFVKRIDMVVVRLYPVSMDTLRYSMTMGYFHFD
ncbi:MAG TPA: hypothetical protein VI932_10920 [Bacteroidota bacterium]|nr:hypothetical protein [Bacteroidota bacterium]